MPGIFSIEYALPDEVLTNEELVKQFHTWSEEKIYSKTGIKLRHIANKSQTASDLGVIAANKLFDNGNIKREDIDFLIFITQSPDYILPTSACLIQDRLGLRKNIGAFDINLGCSGFIYGLATAKGLIDSCIAKNVLLITAETYSKYINKLDKSTRTIFGDGAAATLICENGIQIGNFDLGTDGRGCNLLMVPSGGTRLVKNDETAQESNYEGNIRTKDNLFMDGAGVFEFSIREVPKSIERLLLKEKIDKENIDMFVFHQANKFMLDFLQRKMNIEQKKFYINMSDTGNTVSASIPIALKRAIEDGSVYNNQTVVLSGFGVGLSWGSSILYTGNFK